MRSAVSVAFLIVLVRQSLSCGIACFGLDEKPLALGLVQVAFLLFVLALSRSLYRLGFREVLTIRQRISTIPALKRSMDSQFAALGYRLLHEASPEVQQASRPELLRLNQNIKRLCEQLKPSQAAEEEKDHVAA